MFCQARGVPSLLVISGWRFFACRRFFTVRPDRGIFAGAQAHPAERGGGRQGAVRQPAQGARSSCRAGAQPHVRIGLRKKERRPVQVPKQQCSNWLSSNSLAVSRRTFSPGQPRALGMLYAVVAGVLTIEALQETDKQTFHYIYKALKPSCEWQEKRFSRARKQRFLKK